MGYAMCNGIVTCVEIDDGQCTKSKGSASGSAKQVRVAALADLPMDAGFTTDTASTGAAFVIMTLLGECMRVIRVR